MPSSISDRQVNSDLRPYFTGVSPQDDMALATIVLLGGSNDMDAHQRSVDYINDFNTVVYSPSSSTQGISPAESTPSSAPVVIGSDKTIPKLKGLEAEGQTEYYGVFNNFSLMSVSESKEQLTKIHMNFGGSWNAFFFGDKPTVYNFSGLFIDSQEYPYYQEFVMAYDLYLCGRKCIENNFEMLISYDGKIVYGYILNISTSLDANNPYMKNFSFTVLVKDEKWYRTNVVVDEVRNYQKGFNYMSSARASKTTEASLDMNKQLNSNVNEGTSSVTIPIEVSGIQKTIPDPEGKTSESQ